MCKVIFSLWEAILIMIKGNDEFFKNKNKIEGYFMHSAERCL